MSDNYQVWRTERYVSVNDLAGILHKWLAEWVAIADDTGQNIESMNGINMVAVTEDFMHWIGLDVEEER